MEIGKQDLAFPQQRPFRWLRFLDLDDHVGVLEDLFGVRRYGGACTLVDFVRGADMRIPTKSPAYSDL